jgi:hypothetical protein
LKVPQFEARRPDGSAAWQVSATLDTPAYAGRTGLCRQSRQVFDFTEGRWLARPPDNYVWLKTGPDCTRPPAPARLLHPMSDLAILPLLQTNALMLGRARLLLAGNSGCASQRSFNFKLAALGVSAPRPQGEEMPELRFTSDHGTSARLWIRQSERETGPWYVACP